MKVKGVRLHGAHDIRLEEFEIPEIKDDEILVKVVSDSICMSTWKMVQAGKNHKRVPENVAEHPVIIYHEFTGDIVKVGSKWKDLFHEGKNLHSSRLFLDRWNHLVIPTNFSAVQLLTASSRTTLLKKAVSGNMMGTVILKLPLANQ